MRLATIALFCLQIFLTFLSNKYLGKYINPVFLFAVSLAIPFLFLITVLKGGTGREENRLNSRSWLPILITTCSWIFIAYCYHKGFEAYQDYQKISDVLPQLDALYDRFANGEQPYYPLQLQGYAPYPVYMPAHWIIIGAARLLSIDTRWVGIAVLFVANLLFVYHYCKSEYKMVNRVFAALVVPAILYAFYRFGEGDLFVTFEGPIAAYYLILATGLIRRSFKWTIAGIILCLLSRYTLVFWLPLFALVLFYEKPFKQNLIAAGVVVGAILLFYVIPFLGRQPDILTEGVKYHNHAAVGEWSSGAWSFETGVYFAPHFNALFSGDMESKVFKTRVVQGGLMIALCVIGFVGYRKWRNRINYYDYSLITLYVFLVFFYAFGPLTYRYYLITTLVLSGVICARILSASTGRIRGLTKTV